MPERKELDYKFCCKTLENVIEEHSGTIEMNFSIMNFSKGDFNPPHPVLHLYGLTKNGNPSLTSSKSSWISLYYCPFCGTHIANSVAYGQHKTTKKFVVEIAGKQSGGDFDTHEEAMEYAKTIPLIVER